MAKQRAACITRTVAASLLPLSFGVGGQVLYVLENPEIKINERKKKKTKKEQLLNSSRRALWPFPPK